jgi:hypothetical protein
VSSTTLRLIIALVLFVHGIGHLMGILPMLGLSSIESWNARSWLLTGLLGDTLTRIIGFILFSAATIGFLGATLGLMDWLVPHEWWRTLAAVSAVISLVAIALFWNAFVSFFPNKIGAIAVNVAVLIGLLIADWPTEAQLGY